MNKFSNQKIFTVILATLLAGCSTVNSPTSDDTKEPLPVEGVPTEVAAGDNVDFAGNIMPAEVSEQDAYKTVVVDDPFFTDNVEPGNYNEDPSVIVHAEQRYFRENIESPLSTHVHGETGENPRYYWDVNGDSEYDFYTTNFSTIKLQYNIPEDSLVKPDEKGFYGDVKVSVALKTGAGTTSIAVFPIGIYSPDGDMPVVTLEEIEQARETLEGVEPNTVGDINTEQHEE